MNAQERKAFLDAETDRTKQLVLSPAEQRAGDIGLLKAVAMLAAVFVAALNWPFF